jgi:hypothetical protein
MDDGRTSVHVPAVCVDLLDQEVKEVTHLRILVGNDPRVVFPTRDVVLRYLSRFTWLASVFELERTNLEHVRILNHGLQTCLFSTFGRCSLAVEILLLFVDDVLERVFIYARHRDLTSVTDDELLRRANFTRPVHRALLYLQFPVLFHALSQIEDSITVGLPNLLVRTRTHTF